MMILDSVAAGFFLLVLVISVPYMLLRLGQLMVPDGFERAAQGLRHFRFTIGQLMVAIAVAAGAMAVVVRSFAGLAFLLAAFVLIVAWFAERWRDEIVFLMGLRDEDLPGKHDKILWLVLLVALAPLSVWWFRSYRQAHWPETDPSMNFAHETGPGAKRRETAQPA